MWPAVPDAAAATLLALQQQLGESQWWTPQQLRRHQLRQAARLLAHAARTVPFYQGRLPATGGVIDEVAWASIPLLKRIDVQREGRALRSQAVPADHGQVLEYWTSGSTGSPISFCGSDLTRFFWNVLTLRDHLWHRRDLGAKLAVIRTTVEAGESQGWGPATDAICETGQCVAINIRTDIAAQAEWLTRQDPGYLLSHPSNVLALARHCIAHGIRVPRLRQVRCFGETLPTDLRKICRDAWNADLADTYSAEEAGYIALQCPEQEHYHVQAEALLVEVLDSDGRECGPGEVGRIVLTTLHNFAMPLIRYEIGDYAEVGQPCPCGRGLPVLRRILGRQRNMLLLPDGTQHWPSFPAEAWLAIAPVRQFQVKQSRLGTVEARFVAERALSAKELGDLSEMLKQKLGYPLGVKMIQVAAIERPANCKYEDFICEIPGAV